MVNNLKDSYMDILESYEKVNARVIAWRARNARFHFTEEFNLMQWLSMLVQEKVSYYTAKVKEQEARQ